MRNPYQNQVVFVTGASSGIGKAMGEEYWNQGAKVVFAARRRKRLDTIVTGLNAIRENSAYAVDCDVCDDQSVLESVNRAIEKFKKIDVCIANAGFGVVEAVQSLSLQDFKRQFETNVFGVLRTFYACQDQIIKNKGRFAIIGSINSYVSLPNASAYCMSKHAVKALSESLYHELHPFGASCTLLCPGYVRSEIRHVNNQGRWNENASPQPKFFTLPAEKAAIKIRRAIQKRKRERVVTAHGYWTVRWVRHFPSLFHACIRHLGIRGRRQSKPN